MGLVEASPADTVPGSKSLKSDGVKFVWEDDIEELNRYYGDLIIDYMKSMFGTGFVVYYEGTGC